MFMWEKENRKLYMQKSEGPHGRTTTRMEFATCIGEEIAQGLLYERVDLIPSLTELLKTKNLQLYSEDEDFLHSAFPPENEVSLC